MQLSIKHCATCLPDYFGGHHLAWVCVTVHNKMTFKELKRDLHNELNMGAIGGNEPLTQEDSGIEGDKWFKAAHAAINRDIKPAIKGSRFPFSDIESNLDDDMLDIVQEFKTQYENFFGEPRE
jgi:hypothetical protein